MIIWIPDTCHRSQTEKWPGTRRSFGKHANLAFEYSSHHVSSIFCNLRRGVRSPKIKIICQRSSFAVDFAFSVSPIRRNSPSYTRKNFATHWSGHSRTHVSAIFERNRDRRAQHEAELSGKTRALDPFAQSYFDWDTATGRKNMLFTQNHLYSLYPIYSELFTSRSAINTLRTGHWYLFMAMRKKCGARRKFFHFLTYFDSVKNQDN